MTETEATILATIIDLETTIQSAATAQPKPSLLPIFERLDRLTASLPPTTDGSLLHYMHKKSYQKARLFLQGHDAENQVGNCRHV